MDMPGRARLSLFARGNSRRGITRGCHHDIASNCCRGTCTIGFAGGRGLRATRQRIAQRRLGEAPQTVEIDLDSFSFTPQSLHLKRGTPYRLHFVNKASKGHNYDAPQFFAALAVAPDDQAKVAEGKIEVDKGEAVDVKAVADKAGNYPVKCSHFLHASFGMTGEAVIE